MRAWLHEKLLACLCLSSAAALEAQSFDVKIVQRQTGETGYTYQVAGHANSTSSGSANCNAHSFENSTNVNCNGSGSTETSITAPMVYSYSVTGATFTLRLPD
jgi:hypothetical protein